jgi:hypothetical protein
MQRQVKSTIGLIAVFGVVFGTYFLFRGSPRPNSEAAEMNLPMQVGREGSDEIAPPEPAYDLASLPRIGTGQQVEFGADQDNRALISGWSVPEPGGVWSLGKHAAIGFAFNCEAGACANDNPVLLFQGGVFVVPGQPQQTIEVWLGQKKLNEITLLTPQANFAVALEGVTIIDGTPIILSLRLPDAIAPSEVIKSNDPREIAFRIKSLRLEL